MKKLLILGFILFASCQTESIQEPVIEENTCEKWHPAPQAYYGENKMVGVTESLWPEMKIKVYIDDRFEGERLEWIYKAMAEFEGEGFEFEVSDEFFFENGLNIKYSSVAQSAIGMRGDIIQDMYLPANWGNLQDYIHEFGHAIGMHHPNVTKLRDELLTIHWDNIAEENHDFYKTYEEYGEDYTGQKEGAEYLDYFPTSSVMAYGSYAHSVDGSKPAYTLKDGTLIEESKILSESDKELIANMYCEYLSE